MERVKKGEPYCYIDFRTMAIRQCIFAGDVADELRIKTNNIFKNDIEAEAMSRKLRAVLKGADVIEMPTAKETLKMMPDGIFTGWEKCYEFLKSKIVK